MKTWKTRAIGVAAVIGAALSIAVPAQADPRVGGEIGYAYEYRYNGPRGFLGEPLTPEIRTPNDKGAYVAFQNGSIYWSPWTGAHEVHGEVRNGWGRLGWEGGQLGFPTGDEQYTNSRRGRYQEFEGGSILWAPWSGAHALRGVIREARLSMYDAENILGFPTTSEIRTPNGRGAYNHFQWGSIYWSPGTGAHPVYGAIRDAWASQGWENGRLGFPTDAEYIYEEDFVVQQFEGGVIGFSPGYGAEIFYDLYL
ncbi:LGFP repeat-containing protein [Kineococcus auxinigenes]|uniref:LGFP repeat-containing protein n=1 Tax=unclassified Kineococcus TaxID=2621656 RepID=UPI003D7F16C4